MNWTARIFIASLLMLAGTVGYGFVHYNATSPYQHQASNSQSSPNAALVGNMAFDMQSSALSSSFSSSQNTTSNQQMSMAPVVPTVTVTPPAFHDDYQDDQGEDSSNEARGTVTAVNGNMITINGQTYTISNHSEVNGNIQVGSNVKLEYFMNPDGTLTIEEVKVATNNSTMMSNGESNNNPSFNSSNNPSQYQSYHGDSDDNDGDD